MGAEPKKNICYCLVCGEKQGIFAMEEGRHYPERIDYQGYDYETLFCRYCAHIVTQENQTPLEQPSSNLFIGTCKACSIEMEKLNKEYIEMHSCYLHPKATALKFCSCGRPICKECCEKYSGLYKDIIPNINDGKCADCYDKEVERRAKRQAEIDDWNKKSAIGKFFGNLRGENPWMH